MFSHFHQFGDRGLAGNAAVAVVGQIGNEFRIDGNLPGAMGEDFPDGHGAFGVELGIVAGKRPELLDHGTGDASYAHGVLLHW